MPYLYLAASEELTSHLGSTSSLSSTAKSIPIVKQCCFHEWPMNHWNPLQSGTTLQPLNTQMECLQSTLFTGVSHAKGQALQDLEKAWMISEQDYFTRSSELQKKSNQPSFSLKTQKEFCHAEGVKSLNHLPKSGMYQDGSLKVVKRLDLPKIVKDGFVWPTPNTLDYLPPRPWMALKKQFENARKGRKKPANLREAIHKECYPPIQPYDHKIIGTLNPQFVEWIQGYPLQWSELNVWLIPFALNKQKKPSKN